MQPTTRMKAPRNKKTPAILLVTAGFLILVFSVGYWMIDYNLRNPDPAPIPSDVAGLSLTGSLTGAQAVENISQLHGKDFPLSSGSVAWYGSAREVTLWVSGDPLPFLAKHTLSEMRERIAEGRSPFRPVAERLDGQRVVYELDGMGQKHFYFQSQNLIIWLAAEPGSAEQALSQVLKYYP